MILTFYSAPAVFCDATTYVMFMTIQLHLSHTLVECETKFLNVAWQLQATMRCRIIGQK